MVGYRETGRGLPPQTANLDAIVLINPTANSLDNLTVTANNTGLASASGAFYQIAQDGQSIRGPSSVSLQPQGGTSYSMTVDIPAYSVQAIAISH